MFSFRFKLTCYYLAILTLILGGFGIAIYLYLSRSLVMTIDESLATQVERIERQMAMASGEDGTHRIEEHETLLQITPHVTQIIDDYGRIADEMVASPRDRLEVDLAALKRLPVGKTDFSSITTPAGEFLRVATRRVRDHEGPGTYFIRLGQSLEALRIARRRLIVVLLLTMPVALLLGSIGGLVLANQALRPVDRITRTAERIGGGDLTERVPAPARMDELGRLAATFNQMIARLQAAFERQKQFTSDASHEMRTPLAIMRGDIEITLRRERSREEYQQVLTSTLEEIIRLSRLVEDLLMLARADVGKIELQCGQVNLTQLCREVTEYIAPLAHQREQFLTFTSVGEEDIHLNADAHRLKQLLLNLVDNAIKYTEPRGTIGVSLAVEEGSAVLRVADNGRGISAEDLPRVFDRFFRRSGMASDRSAPGIGLGLSIVKWIVEAHGGKIDVQSALGQGTEFIVRLPLSA